MHEEGPPNALASQSGLRPQGLVLEAASGADMAASQPITRPSDSTPYEAEAAQVQKGPVVSFQWCVRRKANRRVALDRVKQLFHTDFVS